MDGAPPGETSALRGTADTLLHAASCGSRCAILSPATAAGVARAVRPHGPTNGHAYSQQRSNISLATSFMPI